MPSTYSRLVMLGAAPEARGSIGAAIDAYRAHGLFKRWPLEHIAIHGDGGARERAQRTLRGLREFAALLAQHRRIVLHVHSAAGAGFWRDCVFMALASMARCPVVLQLHGSGFERFHDEAGAIARATIKEVFSRAAVLVVPTESQRAWVRSISRESRVACVPHPVTAAAAPAAIQERPNVVLFLGKLEARKGVFDLLEAVAAARAMVPDVRLVCAGEGDRGAIARYAQRLGIADAVKFTGWVGPSGKRSLLDAAAVFALPSYAESMPVSLVEAMAAGIPVIASGVGGIPEAVTDGVTGFLVAPGDTSTLTRVLRKVLLDRTLAARVGAAAREAARLRFAPDRAMARLEEVYAEAGLAALGGIVPREPDMRRAA
jgi:glycosyltransferase involved in cell wall biosynthesis